MGNNAGTPDPNRLLRNMNNRVEQIEKLSRTGTWQPTQATMELVLRHALGILQAVQTAIVMPTAATSSS